MMVASNAVHLPLACPVLSLLPPSGWLVLGFMLRTPARHADVKMHVSYIGRAGIEIWPCGATDDSPVLFPCHSDRLRALHAQARARARWWPSWRR